MTATIKTRRGTASEWAEKNPVLRAGEFGYELDTNRLKVGNGVHAWNDRPYLTSEGAGGGGAAGPLTFSTAGVLDVREGVSRLLWAGEPATISKFTASVETPSEGASIIVRLKKNNITIATATILAGETHAVDSSVASAMLTDGDFLTVSVTQVGSTTPGANLVASAWLS